MSFHGAFTATMAPSDATFGRPSNLLTSSIQSLSSSTSSRGHHASSHISKTYRQASTLFLTRRLPEALTTLLPLIVPPPRTDEADGGVPAEPAPVAMASRSTRIKVWSLYLTIMNAVVELEPEEGKQAFGGQEWRALCAKVREGEVWEEVVRDGYHGVEGDVDADVVINLATLLLAHARTQQLNQKRLENYLAASTAPNLDLARRLASSPTSPSSPKVFHRHRSPSKGRSGADTPRDLNARVKILELYTLHVLLRNDEWDYAREFISMSPVLDEERREAFLLALQSLRDEQQEADRLAQEEKQRRDDQLKKDIEAARKLRAENEEKERRRLEEERARREGSEVDYGIEKTPTPSVAGSSKGRANGRGHGRTNSSLSKASTQNGGQPGNARTSIARQKGTTAAARPVPSIGARAGMAIRNLRLVLEQLSASLRANPVFLIRLLAFILGLVLMFGSKNIRERIQRVLGTGWAKVRATAGMGVKVSYI